MKNLHISVTRKNYNFWKIEEKETSPPMFAMENQTSEQNISPSERQFLYNIKRTQVSLQITLFLFFLVPLLLTIFADDVNDFAFGPSDGSKLSYSDTATGKFSKNLSLFFVILLLRHMLDLIEVIDVCIYMLMVCFCMFNYKYAYIC